MEENIWLIAIVGLVVLAIWAWVLSEIIKSATKDLRQFGELQVRLLAKLCKAHGITQEEINEIVHPKK